MCGDRKLGFLAVLLFLYERFKAPDVSMSPKRLKAQNFDYVPVELGKKPGLQMLNHSL